MENRDPNKKEVWFTADLHLFHKNVIRYSNRPFTDVDGMNATLLENINKSVLPNDDLYILGDLIFGTSAQAQEFLRQVRCKNLFFVFGNHDKEMRKDAIKPFFKSMDEYKEISIHNKEDNSHQKICLFHYPVLEWNGAFRSSWMLHGHTHGNLQYPEVLADKKIADVGVDCWNYSPVSFTQLKELFKNRQNMSNHGD